MSAIKIKENIYAVGAIDYDIRTFHGYETPYGTTYNSYLILDEKISLVDFVKAPFTDELKSNIEEIVPLSKIDYFIVNHIEPDHSGALPALADLVPNASIFCTANAQKGLKAYYKRDFDCHLVKPFETLNTGKFNFTFVPMPMVHWPDSMSTYLSEEKILFSNDAFGQHIAIAEAFDDNLGLDRLLERAGDYYANIVFPFGAQVQKLLSQVSSFDIEIICPSHGQILRSFVPQMVEKYQRWSQNITDENRAVIIFDTMWGSTEIMANSLLDEWTKEGKHVELIDLRKSHISYAMARLLEAKTIAVGSSTLNNNLLPNVASFLTYMKGLKPKGRIGLAFGSYGWSGESIGQIEEFFNALGFELLPSRKAIYRP
ncbi:MAG: FprA family A-type flavoprotein [Clostridiales bacterium]|nr:FprA family A-type flavoprotein [Clostridiales bacterium]